MIDLSKRTIAEEQMDSADLDQAEYAAILNDLARANRLTMNARPTIGFLKRATAGMRRFRLLDVGFGHGDMLRTIARWAERRGIAADLVGVDLNPKSAAVARAATPDRLNIDYRTGDYRDQGAFDFIVSSLVTHHMDDAELAAFLRHMEANSAKGWLVNDLHRLRFPHIGFPILATLMRWHPIVKADGTLSIARSFRPGDWHRLLGEAGIEGARVVRRFPFRLCVERLR